MLIRGLYSETKPLSAITSCCWVKWEVSQSRDPLDTELWPSCNLCLRIWLFRVSADKLTPSASKLALWQTLTPGTSLTPFPGYLQWAVSSLPACRKEFISDFPPLNKSKQSHWAFWVMSLDLKRSPKIILYPHNDISLSLSLTFVWRTWFGLCSCTAICCFRPQQSVYPDIYFLNGCVDVNLNI